jgi:hypothetical protein
MVCMVARALKKASRVFSAVARVDVVMLSAGGFAGAVLPRNTGSLRPHTTRSVVILYKPSRCLRFRL